MPVPLTAAIAPRPPHLGLRLGVAALVALAAVPGVMAQRPGAMVSIPSVQIGPPQPGH